ncbi:MAG: hypothetical protein AABX03_02990 [Nanoarchaeota archaeon]
MKLTKLPKEWENHAKWQYMAFFLDTILPSLKFMKEKGNSSPQGMTHKKWKST